MSSDGDRGQAGEDGVILEPDPGAGTPPFAPRVHQRQALAAVDQAIAAGRGRAWVVLPPGAGKTYVGLEVARRRGRPAVAFGPNTAIQGQWRDGWNAYGVEPADETRAIDTVFTALTYQSLATFADHDTVDDEVAQGTSEDDASGLIQDLHPRGQHLVRRLREIGDVTVVLDECHHLLQVWGRLLREVLAELPDAFVLGLTATPPETLTAAQVDLVAELFGPVAFSASIPAVVREGDLAPFAELAWLTTPTSAETDWLAAQGERFAELTTALTDPNFGSTGFLVWLDQRFGTGLPAEPELRDAALRMVHAGLLALPPGARLTEPHRHRPSAADWVVLIEEWVHLLRGTGHDDDVVERVRVVLPSVGYVLTRRGIRRGRSLVDRVLARSESKTVALEQIVRAEQTNLGERLRMLVLCDHERAAATVPADLEGFVDPQAGSATLALAHLVDTMRELNPLMATGSTVAGANETLEALRASLDRPDLTVTDGRLAGPWSSRDWVPAVTRFFEDGHCRVLIGTRGLLGEGWDARAITGLVDLTTATTSTAVVQTRGRVLRTDPGWPDKVALTWTVVCVSERHPKGDQDWDRFVRKHDRFYGVDADGDVVSGVGHIDAALSPYAPPPVEAFTSVNARMLQRAEQRSRIRDTWAVGTPYQDTFVRTVRITTREPRQPGLPVPALWHDVELEVRDARAAPWRPHPVSALGLLLGVLAVVLGVGAAGGVAVGLVAMAVLQLVVAVRRGRELAVDLTRPPALAQVAYAVADALHEAGLTPVGAGAVGVHVDEAGEYRCALNGVDAAESEVFADALDEVVSPMASPRYVVPRWVRSAPVGPADRWADGLRAALGRLRPDGQVWHSVPAALGRTGASAQIFARSWDRWVGGGPALYTGNPEGEGVLVTHRGSDPFDVTTVLRTHWR